MKRLFNVRFLCAVLGVAAAAGTVVFMSLLKATNDAQGVRLAERMLAAVPVEEGAETLSIAVDYRPDGHVLQGPPMMMTLATVPSADAARLGPGEVVVCRTFFNQRRAKNPPQCGDELKLVGRNGAYTVRIREFIENAKGARGYPCAFVSEETAADIDEEWRPYRRPSAEELAPSFATDGGKNFGRASSLLLWAAALTALCLLVNSLFLSVEANRRETAILRMVGKTRMEVARSVLAESLAATAVGYLVGGAAARAGLALYVATDAETFPAGAVYAAPVEWWCVAAAAAVAVAATLLALRGALAVRPLEAASVRPPRKNRLGMTIAFICGFGAFVAVEVWGSSLMGSFIPSKEWPDAIVSILPGGVSPWDIEKLRDLKGVKEISELVPLQVPFEPLEEMKGFGKREPPPKAEPGKPGGKGGPGGPGGPMGPGGRGAQYKNVLLLASDRLPDFKLVEGGDRETVERAVMEGRGCVITEMMARARGLRCGEMLRMNLRGAVVELPIAGIADVNWHLVTSRGLVRGLNRMPGMTSGPAFISFDTLDSFDQRPSGMIRMTHLWLDYEPEFLAEHGVFPAGRLVEREIAAALGAPEEVAIRLHARDEVADGTLAHGDAIIGSMARIPFVFLLVLTLGFIAMLVAVVDACRQEYVLLRTVGATKMQLTVRLAWEALRTSLAGMAVGAAGGALAGWLFTAGTRAAMSDWGLPPRFVFPVTTVAGGAVIAVAVVLAVAVPVSLKLIGRLTRRGDSRSGR